MIRGLYTSGWSMMANERKMDVISNNLANANTTGFKKDSVIFESFPSLLTKRINDNEFSQSNPSGQIGEMQMGEDVGEVFTYYTQGQTINTNNKFDLAIQDGPADSNNPYSEAFFNVQVPDENGNMKDYYTRDGSFTINVNKQLVTKEGYPVMGQNGPITLDSDNFTVGPDGTITQNGQAVDKLMIKQFSDTRTLRKFGSNLVEATGESQETDFSGQIQQGYSEQSNVNIVKEMVDMITVTRAYEASQKVLQAQDGTLEKAVNEVGAMK